MKPMLAYRCDEPFSDNDWLFELKYDGYRGILTVSHGVPRLWFRSGLEASKLYPEIIEAAANLPDCILDGEVAVFDDEGITNLRYLHSKTRLASFVCFDCLRLGDADLREHHLDSRKQTIIDNIRPTNRILIAPWVIGDGLALWQKICADGRLEGMMSKYRHSPYLHRRAHYWKKTKCSLSKP